MKKTLFVASMLCIATLTFAADIAGKTSNSLKLTTVYPDTKSQLRLLSVPGPEFNGTAETKTIALATLLDPAIYVGSKVYFYTGNGYSTLTATKAGNGDTATYSWVADTAPVTFGETTTVATTVDQDALAPSTPFWLELPANATVSPMVTEDPAATTEPITLAAGYNLVGFKVAIDDLRAHAKLKAALGDTATYEIAMPGTDGTMKKYKVVAGTWKQIVQNPSGVTGWFEVTEAIPLAAGRSIWVKAPAAQ